MSACVLTVAFFKSASLLRLKTLYVLPVNLTNSSAHCPWFHTLNELAGAIGGNKLRPFAQRCHEDEKACK